MRQPSDIKIVDKTLAGVLRLHGMWLRGEVGGERADLRGADLCGADLRDADLRDADLRDADLRDADLRYAVLRDADLRGAVLRSAVLRSADLRGAVLRDADLSYADLSGAVLPEGYRIATLCFGGWPVSVTPEATSIGCQTHPNADWLLWTPEDVADMHEDAAKWWAQHREAVCAVIRDVMSAAEGGDRG